MERLHFFLKAAALQSPWEEKGDALSLLARGAWLLGRSKRTSKHFPYLWVPAGGFTMTDSFLPSSFASLPL